MAVHFPFAFTVSENPPARIGALTSHRPDAPIGVGRDLSGYPLSG
jgi:hypothetical protein